MRTSTGPSAMPWANLAFSRLRMSVAAGLSVCSLRTIAAGSPWPLPALPGAAPPKSQIFWLWGRKRQCLAVGLAQGCKQIKAPDDPTCETVVLKCRLVWRDVWRDAWWWVYEMRCVRWDVGLKFVLRLPHESSAKSTPLATRKQTGPSGVQARRQSPESQCCACHAKATPGAAKCESSAKSIKCWPCHAKATGLQRRPSARRQSPESQSIAPATQKQHQVQLCEMNCVRWGVWVGSDISHGKRHITRCGVWTVCFSVVGSLVVWLFPPVPIMSGLRFPFHNIAWPLVASGSAQHLAGRRHRAQHCSALQTRSGHLFLPGPVCGIRRCTPQWNRPTATICKLAAWSSQPAKTGLRWRNPNGGQE